MPTKEGENSEGGGNAPKNLPANNQHQKKKSKAQSKDALKKNDLSQKTMLSIEAGHISGILKHCISQIETVAALPAILRLHSFSFEMDEELIRELKKHQLLDDRLETQEDLKQESEGEDGEASIRVRAKLQSTIKFSVRDLLRLFQSHPDAFTRLMAEQGMEVGESESKLVRNLKMFHSHMVNKLANVNAMRKKLQKKVPLPSLDHSLKQIASQEEKVAESMKQIGAKICHQNTDIKTLQCTLEADDLEAAAADARQLHASTSKEKDSLQQEVDELTSQLNNLMLKSREAEETLQEINRNIETEMEDLIQTFDTEMEQKQVDLELNEIHIEKEEEELRVLEKPFTLLEMEYNQIRERRQREEEQRQKEMKVLELKTRAAVFAQAWWRGYKTRQALQDQQNAKKGKKGKGKGKGKGKKK